MKNEFKIENDNLVLPNQSNLKLSVLNELFVADSPKDIAKNLRGIQHSLNVLMAAFIQSGQNTGEWVSPDAEDLYVLNSVANKLEEIEL